MDVINDTSKTKAGLLSTAIQIYVTLCCIEIITPIGIFKNAQKKRFDSALLCFYHLLKT